VVATRQSGVAPAEGREGGWGAWLGALHERDFAILLFGRLISWVGTGMVPVALSFAILDRGGNASQVGWVLAAETIPLIVFLLGAGVVADRTNRRLLMLSADLLRAGAQSVLAAWVLLGHPPLSAFLCLEAVVGTGTAWFTPAMSGILPSAAPSTHLQQANSLWATAQSIGLLAGPGLAGIIVAAAGPGWALAADATSYAVSAGCLSVLRLGWSRPTPTGTHFGAQLATGWSEFRSRTWLWSVVTQFSLLGAVVFAPFLVLGAVVAKRSLGGAGAWGLVLAANGAGAVVAGVVLLRARPQRPLLTGEVLLLAWALPLLSLAFNAPLAVLTASAFAAGAAQGAFDPLWGTTMQLLLPGEVLSRVSAYEWFGSLVFLPLGYMLAGPLSDGLGIRLLLLVATGWLVVSTMAVLALRQVRTMTLPAAPHP
jgi:MFS family permease